MYDIEREMIARAQERRDDLCALDRQFIDRLATLSPRYIIKPGELKKLRNIHVQLQGGEFWGKVTTNAQTKWPRE